MRWTRWLKLLCAERGTDYGDIEYSLEEKVDQVRRQLMQKEALILYDERLESTTIIPASDVLEAY